MKKPCHKTQGRTLIAAAKQRPLTYWQMLGLTPSASPWKRIKESLLPGESVIKGRTRDGWTTWRVVADKKA
jgi:hypothetical protein